MDDVLKEITVGALLHDIGKVIQRANETPERKRHQEWGEEWFKGLPSKIKHYLGPCDPFILRHHALKKEDPKYAILDVFAPGFRGDLALVWEADNLSAGERKEDPEEELENLEFDLSMPLYSIFNKVFRPLKQYRSYPPVALADEGIPFPEDPRPITPGDYQRLLERFERGLEEGPTEDPVQHLLNLLESSFSFVPSETAFRRDDASTYPDVSLYDHLKLTAAIASCMYHYFLDKGKSPGDLSREEIADRDEARFLLVGGDFSGIQDFIYTVSYRAALKGLRARSFYIELLLEHFADTTLQKLSLTRANLIYLGGGSLYFLAPNTEKIKDVLRKRQEVFNRYLLKEHGGKLFFALSFIELNGYSLLGRPSQCPPVSEAWQKVHQKLEEQKNRKFQGIIDRSFFLPPEGDFGLPCGICQKISPEVNQETDPETGEIYLICRTCEELQKLGGELPKANYIEVTPLKGPFALTIEDRNYRLSEKPSESAKRFFSINHWHRDAVTLWFANYPRKGLDFSEVVEKALGARYLGTFRADVDNLGQLFSLGIPERARTLSRMATLSRMFSLFFKRYINDIAEGKIPEELSFNSILGRERTKGDRELVVVYSGGDDLFVTGAWSDVVEFAIEMRRAFKGFVAHNPSITISGGLVLTPPKFPIYRISQLAAEAESRAKANHKDGREKDSASLFDEIHFWDEWEEALKKILEPLSKLGELKGRHFVPYFSRGLVYKLLALSEKGEKLERKNKELAYFILPPMVYVLRRSRPKKGQEIWEELLKGALSWDLKESLRWLKLAKGPLKWLDYMMRG